MKWIAGAISAVLISVVGGAVLFMLQQGPLKPQPPPSPAPAREGAILGVAVSRVSPCCTWAVRVLIVGFEGQECKLTSVLVDNNTGQGAPSQTPTIFTPSSNYEAETKEVFVGPSYHGTYYVLFILSNPSGTELARAQTPLFNV